MCRLASRSSMKEAGDPSCLYLSSSLARKSLENFSVAQRTGIESGTESA